MDYDIQSHRFRFAAWCAATAASASSKCRFSVETGVQILKISRMDELAKGWGKLPPPEDFDRFHSECCVAIVTAAGETSPDKFSGTAGEGKFTYGVAAKLLNCYLKPLFVAGVQETLSSENIAKQNAIHPPIDRLLLAELYKDNAFGEQKFWKEYMQLGWSNFGQDDYRNCVEMMKSKLLSRPMWEIEKYWKGFQDAGR